MKKFIWITAAALVLIVGLSWFFALAFPPDPNIETYSAKMNEAYWMDPVHVQESITAIDFSYYRVSDWGSVTYEETEDQRIFYFQNKALPERYEQRTLGNPPEREYSEANRVAIFTKDWILQSLTVTERWREAQSDGTRLPMEKICHAIYLPCTQESFLEDIEKVVWGYRPNFPLIENSA